MLGTGYLNDHVFGCVLDASLMAVVALLAFPHSNHNKTPCVLWKSRVCAVVCRDVCALFTLLFSCACYAAKVCGASSNVDHLYLIVRRKKENNIRDTKRKKSKEKLNACAKSDAF